MINLTNTGLDISRCAMRSLMLKGNLAKIALHGGKTNSSVLVEQRNREGGYEEHLSSAV